MDPRPCQRLYRARRCTTADATDWLLHVIDAPPRISSRVQSSAGKTRASRQRSGSYNGGAVDLDVIAVQGVGPMALTRGRFLGCEFDRMVMLFSMVDGQREIPCAISTSTMDDLEGVARSRPNQREAQFMRLRDRIEERATRKFVAMEFEGTPGIILRSIDFKTQLREKSASMMHGAISANPSGTPVLGACIKTTWRAQAYEGWYSSARSG